MKEFGVFAEGRFDACVFGVLDSDLPVVLDHPARDEVVVVGVQSTDFLPEPGADVLVREGGDEGLVVEDLGAVSGGATGYHEHASVDGVGGRCFEVVALEIETAEEVPEAGGAVDSLVGADAADDWILEGSEDGGEEGAGPEDVIVTEDDEVGFHLEGR